MIELFLALIGMAVSVLVFITLLIGIVFVWKLLLKTMRGSI